MLTLRIHACDTFSVEELEKLILEEQILAEVEKIMEIGMIMRLSYQIAT